jgi:hypothetical protein
MTTGSFWNVDDPLKPWGYMDPDDVLNIPFDFADWLSDQGTSYSSHLLTSASELTASNVAQASGVVTVQVKKATGQTLTAGNKYWVTCQITCADGQKKSKTLWFKAKEL